MTSKAFIGRSKGELLLLRDQLDGNDESERKLAAKRVVSLMRAGENVSCFFSSMFRCVTTNDMELRKLAYHYIITYAPEEPEQSIMAVNFFIQDSKNPNPLIRALAVRTMCRIRVSAVAEYILPALKTTLTDKSPYVRKTAALAVAKLYNIIPETVEDSRILSILVKMIYDENPMVVSNTIASILEINEQRTSPIFEINEKTVSPILNALSESNEWVQTVLLDALSHYTPKDADEASSIIDRLIPFLKHSNPAVVIGSFKNIFQIIDIAKRTEQEVFPLIIPPFITLVSTGEPEVQFVVLRTLSLFVHKYPKALTNEIRVFFCKYNDPSYIKMEKLEIITRLSSSHKISLVLSELDEYCNAVDIGFVKKSIHTLGKIAIKIESTVRRVVDILVRLIQSKIDYAIEESIVVVTEILRRFPGEFESIISIICSNLENIKSSKAKASAVWIIGEYCHLIDKVDLLLDPFLDTFHDETQEVQIQLLTAVVKVFLHNEEASKDQMQFILNESIKESCLPDIRNRGLIYWRLLSADIDAAKKTVVFPKNAVSHSGEKFKPEILDELIRNMGNVAGILHVIPSDFLKRIRFMPEDETNDMENEEVVSYEQVESDQLIGIFVGFSTKKMFLKVINKYTQPISNFALALNKNTFGIAIDQTKKIDFPADLQFGETFEVSIPIVIQQEAIGNVDSPSLQFALRINEATKLFKTRVHLPFVTTPVDKLNFRLSKLDEFINIWTNKCNGESPVRVEGNLADEETLRGRNISVIPNNEEKTGIVQAYFEINTVPYLVKARQNSSYVEIIIRSASQVSAVIQGSISTLFCN
jgi:AP-1 complex subunit beta-1